MFMMLTETEIKFVFWGIGILLAVLAFIGVLAVNALMQLSRDVNEIKTSFASLNAQHDGHEKQIDELGERVDRLEKKVFAL